MKNTGKESHLDLLAPQQVKRYHNCNIERNYKNINKTCQYGISVLYAFRASSFYSKASWRFSLLPHILASGLTGTCTVS